MVTVSLICAALCRRFAEESRNSQREGLALRMLFDLDSNKLSTLEMLSTTPHAFRQPRNDAVQYKLMIRGNTIGTNGKLATAWRVMTTSLVQRTREPMGGVFRLPPRAPRGWRALAFRVILTPNAVFETINCRGRQLDEFDLIRNFIYSHFNNASESERRETVHKSLERIRQMFPSTKTKNKAEEYTRCRMQCRFGFLAKDNFYRDVRRTVRHRSRRQNGGDRRVTTSSDGDRYREKEDLELYRRLTVPTASPEFLQEFEMRSRTMGSPRNLTVFLRELKEYSVTHTLVFALMSKYVDETDGRKKRRVASIVNRNLSRLASFVLRRRS